MVDSDSAFWSLTFEANLKLELEAYKAENVE